MLSSIQKRQASTPRAGECSVTVLTIGAVRWAIREDFERNTIASVLEHPDAQLKNPKLLFKSSRVVTVGRIPASVRTPALVLRRLNYGKWRHRLRDCFRPSRARRAFRIGLLLENAGVATARVVAAGERRVGRWPVAAYLITEEIVGAKTLAQLVRPKWRLPRGAISTLAELLAQLHNAGFSHQDLKASNILFDSKGNPVLIDLDGVRRFSSLSEGRAIADLARLLAGVLVLSKVPLAVQARFLGRYLKQRSLGQSIRTFGERIVAELH